MVATNDQCMNVPNLNPNLCHIHHVLYRHGPEDQGQLLACLWVPAPTSRQNNACGDCLPNFMGFDVWWSHLNSTSLGWCAEVYAKCVWRCRKVVVVF